MSVPDFPNLSFGQLGWPAVPFEFHTVLSCESDASNDGRMLAGMNRAAIPLWEQFSGPSSANFSIKSLPERHDFYFHDDD
jgi:hypothetical protein